MPLVQIDNGAPLQVSPALLQDYILEQLKLRQWLITCYSPREGLIEAVDGEGGEHSIKYSEASDGPTAANGEGEAGC